MVECKNFNIDFNYFPLQKTFVYYSSLWKTKDTYNLDGGKTGFDFQESKLVTYSSSPFTKICLGTKFQNQNRFIVINKTANSLFSLIADGSYRPTTLGRDTWKKLFGDSASLETHCNREGFNLRCTGDHVYLSRIGITTNDAPNCHYCGANIAFGSTYYGCVNVGSPQADNENELHQAMGYIMVY